MAQLAKESTITNLMRQRVYIEMKLNDRARDIDPDKSIYEQFKDDDMAGDPSYTYIGYVYPQNIEYFQAEGFDVKEIHPQDGFALTRGKPVFLFTPSPTIKLTRKEMEQSEEEVLEGEYPATQEEEDDFVMNLFGRNKNKTQPTNQG